MFKLCESQEINDKLCWTRSESDSFVRNLEMQLWSREIKVLRLQLLLSAAFRHIYLGVEGVFMQSTFASQTALRNWIFIKFMTRIDMFTQYGKKETFENSPPHRWKFMIYLKRFLRSSLQNRREICKLKLNENACSVSPRILKLAPEDLEKSKII